MVYVKLQVIWGIRRTQLAMVGSDIMRLLRKGRLRFLRGQRGISLIEVLVAVAILGAIGVAFMTSMNTAHKSVGVLDEKTQAEALARSQLEQIRDAPYEESEVSEYPRTDMYLEQRITDLPPQYSIVITVEAPTCIGEADDCTPLEELLPEEVNVKYIQQIRVSVFRPTDEGDRAVFSISCYKSKVE